VSETTAAAIGIVPTLWRFLCRKGHWLRRAGTRVDLKTRLSVFIGIVLGVVLVVALFAVLNNSRRAVQHEIDSVMWLASELIDERRLNQGGGAENAVPNMSGLLHVLDHTRHLCVVLESEPLNSNAQYCPGPINDAVPQWFSARVTVAPRELRRTLMDANGSMVTVVIHSDPAEEILEAWQEVRPLLLLLLVIGFLTNTIVVVTVWRALRPIELIRDALVRIGRGEPTPRLPHATTPELQTIVDGVAELGANLAQAQSDNRRLLRQSLEVQERERRLIARDLHDEIGQNLAAMDTEAALLQQYGLSGNPELKQRILGIRAGITALYDSLHGLLARLRPAGLDEFGLGSALQSLIADWSSRCPQICFKARIEVEHIEGNSLTQIHLYRIAQEALTNAVRHSGADTISLILSRNANGNICLQISDDGRGMLRSAPAAVVGVTNDGRVRLGLIGMAERAEILGTRLIVDTVGGQGTRISTCLPNALPDRNASVVSHGAVT